MKNEEKKLAKNTALLILGNFSSKLLIFFLVPLYTSVLSTSEYATTDLISTTVNLLYPLATLVISSAVMRYCLDKNRNKKQLLSAGIWIMLAGIVAVAIGSLFFFNEGGLVGYRSYFLAYFAGYSFYTLMMEYTKGCEKVALYSIAGVCNTLVLIICNLLFLLKMELGIKGYLLALILGHWVTVIILFVGNKAWKDIVLPIHVKENTFKHLLTYSIPMMPNQISWWISNSSDRYIMGIFRGLTELGVYSVSYKIPSILSTISGIMVSAWEMSAVDDFGTEKSRIFFSKIYDLWIRTYIVLCVGITLFVKIIAMMLFQKDFYIAWRFVPILLYASVFSGLSSFLGTIFTSAKKTSAVFVTTMLGAVTNIVLNFIFIPFIGGYGAAIATAVSYVVTFLSRLKISKKIMILEANHKANFRKILLLLLMVICSCLDLWINYVIGIMILIAERKFIGDIVKNIFLKATKNFRSFRKK